jgi:rubrerythrin
MEVPMPDKRPMTDSERGLFELLKEAIQAERSAQKMYEDAQGLTADPMFRAVLKGLKDDEVRHEKALIARYQQFASEFDTAGE